MIGGLVRPEQESRVEGEGKLGEVGVLRED